MVLKKPDIPQDLKYLRLVVGQDADKDDPRDVKLKNYRQTMNDNRQWILSQLATAEAKYKNELIEWNQSRRKKKATEDTGPVDACEVLVQQLLDEYQASLLQ